MEQSKFLKEIIFEENQPRMEFIRPEDGPTYAPYRIAFE